MRKIQVQPGISTWFAGPSETCDHPTAPPASTSRNNTNVLANVPFAVITAVCAAGGRVPSAVTVPSAPGAAQPGSHSSRTASKRLSFSAGFAMACSVPGPVWVRSAT
jgi:hypothetical protein